MSYGPYGLSVPINGRWLQAVTGGAVPATFVDEQGEPRQQVSAEEFPAAADEALELYLEYVDFGELNEKIRAHLKVAIDQAKATVAAGIHGSGPLYCSIAGYAGVEGDVKPDFLHVNVSQA